MLASITPLGERGRNRNWTVTAAFYLVGSIIGGATWGAVGLVTERLMDRLGINGRDTLIIVGVLAAAALIVDSGVARGALPTIRRQVNENWLNRYRGWVYGVGFGFQLGLGVVTIVTTASVYLVVCLAVLSGSVVDATIIGATFGFVRAIPLLLAARVTTFPSLTQLHRRLESLRAPVHSLTLGSEILIGAAAALAVGRFP